MQKVEFEDYLVELSKACVSDEKFEQAQELECMFNKSVDTFNQFVELITRSKDSITKNGERDSILRLALLLSESLNNRDIYVWAKAMLEE